ncbi:MAG: MiaB/RimO family radical SAM methylthiotransferase [Desulfamplus sp.]|nr:MiaB/RimO family radical SAM methylthiotransferase [Desulfamplus sp.]
MKKFYIATLGCKVNQYESDGIASQLIEKGWQKVDKVENADFCIVNTCAVTSKGAMQSRQQIRSIAKANLSSKIIVTGCYAQTSPDEIKKIEGVDLIVGYDDKFRLADILIKSVNNSINKKEQLVLPNSISELKCVNNKIEIEDGDIKEKEVVTPFFKPAITGDKTRAYLKIQDGCNAFCTYCIVPYSRGRSRSMPLNDVIEHLLHLSLKGYKEAILTGIHVGAYGMDFEDNLSIINKHDKNNIENEGRDKISSPLTQLLIEINRLKPIHRVRLSSIEPKELTDDIINLASKNSILCDHFHIPLQSGDDTILKRMGRPYNSELFFNLITKIYNILPNAAIGVDVLVGFPGESNQAFENTFNLIEQLPISYLHVFPFSPRKGTKAYSYPDRVNNTIVKERSALLRELGFQKRREFEDRLINQNKYLGEHIESVVQDKRDNKTGKLIAITSNYLSVLVDGNDELKRQVVEIKLEGRDKESRLTGEYVSAI